MGRVQVAPDLTCPDHPEVYVIGDIATLTDVNGVAVPGLAPAAIQQGRHAARNILAQIDDTKTEPFAFKDKGNLATIGRSAAVAELGRFKFAGFFAWVLWSFVHIMFLIGFRNRVSVMWDWALSYLFYQRGAQLILERPFAPRGLVAELDAEAGLIDAPDMPDDPSRPSSEVPDERDLAAHEDVADTTRESGLAP